MFDDHSEAARCWTCRAGVVDPLLLADGVVPCDASWMESIAPRLEGAIQVEGGRRLGFAEFGPPDGRAVVWLHGTPGARRQIPHEARVYAERHGVRIVGIDRPGIGLSTSHLYDRVIGFADDMEIIADRLGLSDMSVIGLSGGGPYALASGAALPHLVRSVGVLGGVAPTRGIDRIEGGMVALGQRFAPLIAAARQPLAFGLTNMLRVARPLASPALDLYARVSPEGDRNLLQRPEFKAMFLDDLLNGSRRQIGAPLADVLLFSRHWGFHATDVKVPVRWWHGDADQIIPFGHGRHMVERLPDAELIVLEGESHLGGLGVGEDILERLFDIWQPATSKASGATRRSRA